MTVAGSPLAIFEAPALQALVVGIAVGAGFGKFVVRLRESRDDRELPARTVRRIEAAWIAAGVLVAWLFQAITELS